MKEYKYQELSEEAKVEALEHWKKYNAELAEEAVKKGFQTYLKENDYCRFYETGDRLLTDGDVDKEFNDEYQHWIDDGLTVEQAKKLTSFYDACSGFYHCHFIYNNDETVNFEETMVETKKLKEDFYEIEEMREPCFQDEPPLSDII